MPGQQNTWRGMRLDVIQALQATNFHGLLRYPGGCFAPFYRWKIGLLPHDSRPTIETPPQYCSAVAGGVNAYTDGALENGIGIDDYLALCEKLNMVPAITISLQFGTADEVQVRSIYVHIYTSSVYKITISLLISLFILSHNM